MDHIAAAGRLFRRMFRVYPWLSAHGRSCDCYACCDGCADCGPAYGYPAANCTADDSANGCADAKADSDACPGHPVAYCYADRTTDANGRTVYTDARPGYPGTYCYTDYSADRDTCTCNPYSDTVGHADACPDSYANTHP